MSNIDEYLKVLDLPPRASSDEVKRAYRDLVKVWHPDRFTGDPSLQRKTQEKLKEINVAYDNIKACMKTSAAAELSYASEHDSSAADAYVLNLLDCILEILEKRLSGPEAGSLADKYGLTGDDTDTYEYLNRTVAAYFALNDGLLEDVAEEYDVDEKDIERFAIKMDIAAAMISGKSFSAAAKAFMVRDIAEPEMSGRFLIIAGRLLKVEACW